MLYMNAKTPLENELENLRAQRTTVIDDHLENAILGLKYEIQKNYLQAVRCYGQSQHLLAIERFNILSKPIQFLPENPQPTQRNVSQDSHQQQISTATDIITKRPKQLDLLLKLYDYFHGPKHPQKLTQNRAAKLFGIQRGLHATFMRLKEAGLAENWPIITPLGIQVATELKYRQQQARPTKAAAPVQQSTPSTNAPAVTSTQLMTQLRNFLDTQLLSATSATTPSSIHSLLNPNEAGSEFTPEEMMVMFHEQNRELTKKRLESRVNNSIVHSDENKMSFEYLLKKRK